MKKYAVIGAGLMGRLIARDLAATEPDAEVTVLDALQENLDNAVEYADGLYLKSKLLDVTDRTAAVAAIEGCDAAVAALPHGMSMYAVEAAVEAAVPLVDLVGSFPEKRIANDEKARAADCIVIPACGVAPGISNMCVGRAIELLDETENAYIYVGGIPVRKEPPLYYQTVYLLESVFNAYSRNARIKVNGKKTEAAPLTGIEPVEFSDPPGMLEAFFTDGLSSLIVTVADQVRNNLFEKTLRYPGHADGIRFLQECGLFETSPVRVRKNEVVPRDLLTTLLEERMRLSEEGDILAMRVIAEGTKDGRKTRHVFELLDFYDRDTDATAMARTTGYPAAIAARMITNGEITETGVHFPEQLFTGERFEIMRNRLSKKGVEVSHKVD